MTELNERWLNRFLGFALKRTDNRADAEELAQEIALRCLEAVRRGGIDDPEKYFWGIAHHAAKRFYLRREIPSPDDVFTNLPADDLSPEETAVETEEAARIRRALSALSGKYREILVDYYYRELPVAEIARRRELSADMVKFYLRSGREKMKERYLMNSLPGLKSLEPSPFHIYKSAIDFSKVNVWEVFRRRLPCQIALIAYAAPKTVDDIAAELGAPAVYIEDELSLLMQAGVILSPVRGKFRTNFHILTADSYAEVIALFREMYRDYVPVFTEEFRRRLPQMKQAGVFSFDAEDNRYAWLAASEGCSFDWRNIRWNDAEYPQILSCGSHAFLFAAEAEPPRFTFGATPTFTEDGSVCACDLNVNNMPLRHHQEELWDKHRCQVLFDLYHGRETDEETLAESISLGYVRLIDGRPVLNLAVLTPEYRKILSEMEEILSEKLAAPSAKLLEKMRKLVKATIPPQLADYAEGFAKTWISFLGTSLLTEALYDAGFLKLAEQDETPYLCVLRPNS